jgi:hypothetical protein
LIASSSLLVLLRDDDDGLAFVGSEPESGQLFSAASKIWTGRIPNLAARSVLYKCGAALQPTHVPPAAGNLKAGGWELTMQPEKAKGGRCPSSKPTSAENRGKGFSSQFLKLDQSHFSQGSRFLF